MLPKPSQSGRARPGTTGTGGRPYAWYFQQFETMVKENYFIDGAPGRAWQCFAGSRFDDKNEELLLKGEEDLVSALQGAPAHIYAHSDAPSISEQARSGGNDAVSVDWDE
jgi:hypothetical protein